MIILHPLADHESIFFKYSLKLLDKDNALNVFVYHTALYFTEKIETGFN